MVNFQDIRVIQSFESSRLAFKPRSPLGTVRIGEPLERDLARYCSTFVGNQYNGALASSANVAYETPAIIVDLRHIVMLTPFSPSVKKRQLSVDGMDLCPGLTEPFVVDLPA